ncbi:DIS3-like exonuclease 2 [Panonychus citri]|uniref:DIS3-like exonuclease 2 n=1 Tax=Panonychus citri TaxID=50023 RepID=UPI0023076847|nr:DIS3-like exonuclease 2 [Panonychus citri]
MNVQRSRLPTYTANGNTYGYNSPLTNRRGSLSTPSPTNNMFSPSHREYHQVTSPFYQVTTQLNNNSNSNGCGDNLLSSTRNSLPRETNRHYATSPTLNYTNHNSCTNNNHNNNTSNNSHRHQPKLQQQQQHHHHPHFHHHHHPYNNQTCHGVASYNNTNNVFTSNKNYNNNSYFFQSAPSSTLTSPRCSLPGTPNDHHSSPSNQFKLESPSIKSSSSTPSRVMSRQTSSTTSSSATKNRKPGLTKSSTVASVLSDSSIKTATSSGLNSRRQFDSYMPLCEVQSALKKGEVIEGVLRINPKNFEDAYISAPDGRMDIYIAGIEGRNRAFNGDRVAVALNPPKKWKILYEKLRVKWKDWGQEIDETLRNQLSLKEDAHPKGFWPTPVSGQEESEETSHSTKSKSSKVKRKSDPVMDPQPYAPSYAITEEHILDMINDLEDFHCSIFSNEQEPIDDDDEEEEENGSDEEKTPHKTPTKTTSSKKSKSESDTTGGKKKKKIKSKSKESSSTTPSKSRKKEEVKVNIPEGLPSYFVDLTAENFVGCPHWEEFIQRTGQVKAIMSEVHSRFAGGKLKLAKDRNTNWALFCPTDSKVPRMLIPMDQCPPDFMAHSNHYDSTMFIARIVSWEDDSKLPIGTLVKKLGSSGDINVETEIILTENGIDDSEFDEDIIIGLPTVQKSTDYKIPNKELLTRKDFHDVCVFTIDPSTARDLDDAISIRDIENEKGLNGCSLYEVAVHIADVSYFLKEGLPVDEEARKRTTSFYLVQKMIPMLPRVLCECLCSLNPGEDKLTFSVIWTMDEEGNTYGEPWFGRSIIQSCVKLSYEIAQDMVDDPEREWTEQDFPKIYGNWTVEDINRSVNLFMKMARKIRNRRLETGALNMREAKLAFVLDSESGLPLGFTPHKHLESHFLIEEFMLMANMAVAKKIHDTFPEHAFLRRHEPPDSRMLKQFQEYCVANGMKNIDISSAKSIQKTLNSIDDPLIYTSLSNVLLRSLTQAKYFCSGSVPQSPSFFRHYALNVDLYTHFTSPIRRYPDVIVHRLLAAALDCGKMIKDSPEELQQLAAVCNVKKNASRLASTSSGKLFVALYIKQCGIVRDEAVVVQIYDHSFDVMCTNCNEFCRVYCDKLEVDHFEFEESVSGSKVMKLFWKGAGAKVQTITPFTKLNVEVSISPSDIHKWIVIAVNPFTNTEISD